MVFVKASIGPVCFCPCSVKVRSVKFVPKGVVCVWRGVFVLGLGVGPVSMCVQCFVGVCACVSVSTLYLMLPLSLSTYVSSALFLYRLLSTLSALSTPVEPSPPPSVWPPCCSLTHHLAPTSLFSPSALVPSSTTLFIIARNRLTL